MLPVKPALWEKFQSTLGYESRENYTRAATRGTLKVSIHSRLREPREPALKHFLLRLYVSIHSRLREPREPQSPCNFPLPVVSIHSRLREPREPLRDSVNGASASFNPLSATRAERTQRPRRFHAVARFNPLSATRAERTLLACGVENSRSFNPLSATRAERTLSLLCQPARNRFNPLSATRAERTSQLGPGARLTKFQSTLGYESRENASLPIILCLYC